MNDSDMVIYSLSEAEIQERDSDDAWVHTLMEEEYTKRTEVIEGCFCADDSFLNKGR